MMGGAVDDDHAETGPGPERRAQQGLATRRAARADSFRPKWRQEFARFAVVILTVVIFFGFGAWLPQTFLTWSNVQGILNSEIVSILLALAVLIPMVVGYFDLSTATMLSFGGILLVKLDALPTGVAIVLCVLAGAAVGGVNGYIVAGLGIDSFIVTIGMMTILSGVCLALTNGGVLFQGVGPGIYHIAAKPLPGIGVEDGFIYALAVTVILWYVFQHTRLGRFLYGIGSSRQVARLSGIPVLRLSVLSLVCSGALSAFGGVVETSIIGSGNPTVGPSFLLPAFAAVFLGAATITIGHANVWGTVVAVTLITIITTGLGQLAAPEWVSPVFDGGILIVAVVMATKGGSRWLASGR
jgi:ribose transport system permease protein